MFSSAQIAHSKSKARSTPSPSVSGETLENRFCVLVCLQKAGSPKPFCDLLYLVFADNCKKLGLVFDDVVGIVEIINSRDVKVQVSVCNLFPAWSVTAAPCNRTSAASAALSSVFPEQERASVENVCETPSVRLLCSSPCPACRKGLKFLSLKLCFRALDKR